MQEYKNLLSCWHKLEYFTPFNLPKSNTVIELTSSVHVPWFGKIVDFDAKTTVIHTVYLGVIPAHVVSDFVYTFYKEKNKNENKEDALIAYASLKLDASGRYIPNTFGVSTLPWALGQVEQNTIVQNEWNKDFIGLINSTKKNIEDYLYNVQDDTHVYSSQGGERNKLPAILDYQAIKSIEDVIKNDIGWSLKPDSKIYIDTETVPLTKAAKKERQISSSCAVLNSFYVKDIEDIIAKQKDISSSSAFARYIEGALNQRKERKNIKEDVTILKKTLTPESFPDGCWPSPYSLNLMQQFAVNTILSKAKAGNTQEKLFSVNGPPGTGKTTLLRHALAGIIVERAKLLAKYTTPEEAFTQYGTISNESDYSHSVYTLIPELCTGGIVIASSNNGAVENISQELPLKSEIAPYDELIGYFKEVAEEISDNTKWGTIAAVLGNSSNKNKFIDDHWVCFKEGKGTQVGLQNFFKKRTLKSTATWKTIVEKFENKLQEVAEEKQRIESIRQRVEKYEQIDISRLETDYRNTQSKLKNLDSEYEDIETQFYEAKEVLTVRWDRIALIRSTKPSFLSYFFKTLKRKEYNQRLTRAYSEQKEAQRCCDVFEEKLKRTEKERASLQKEFDALKIKYIAFKEDKEIISQAKSEFGGNFADANFWEQIETSQVQNSCPWYTEKLQTLQIELFGIALELQQTFLLTANRKKNMIVKSLSAFFDLLKGKLKAQPEEIEALWHIFFMVVPVISTTFASVGRMFRGVGAEALPWLFIDEAGQAIPLAGAGAIWRSKNVVVVGDPVQIQPVVTTADIILEKMREHYQLNSEQIHAEISIQVVSDRVNPLGMELLSSNGNTIWVGAPLRVHRRCIEPMFSIANSIAYDNSMFLSTQKPKDLPLNFNTEFIHVVGNVSDRHYVKEQAIVVGNILSEEIRSSGEVPDVYIITPFKEISIELRKFLKKNISFQYAGMSPKESIRQFAKWIDTHVGTVHTFQGKQAEGVIFCLGLDERTEKAATWASQKPNILNVALTRAKYKFIAIGDANIWLNKQYFKQLKVLNHIASENLVTHKSV